MNKTEKNEILANLNEAVAEISRLNKAAGHTVFNPAALEGLRYAQAVILNSIHAGAKS